MEKMIEDLFNRGYAYDVFREEKNLKEIAPISFPGSKTFDIYEGFEADVEFYLEKYNQDVMDGVIGPEVDAVEYIAGRIDEKYPTDNPMQFDSLVREVRALIPRDLLDNIREAQISGVMEYSNGEASGRALAGENADKGIRDVTDGTKGRGQAEVDRTGIYVGVPMGLDKTAWENIAAVQQDYPNVARRAKAFQNAYKNAPEQEKKAMLDWTPENPDMSINLDGQVIDNNINKVMKTQTAPKPQAKSSILQKLGFKESLFEEVLNASKLRESCSTSEECDESILDKDYFWLRIHGYWCIDIETENSYCFNLYANDMDPSKWFGQLNKKNGGDGRNHTIYDIHSSKCYSELGSYDRPDSGTPRRTFERTPYGKEKIVSVKANKPSITLDRAVEYGVIISVKKKLCQLSYKAAADQLYRREINKVLEPYGKEYPEVDGNWELVDKLVAEAVANIKAEKKAAAAAKKAAREGVEDSKSHLFESILCNESIIRRYLYYCKDCHREYYAGSEEPKPCPSCGKENNISYVEKTYW
ncbi:MAG: hypothetical protein II304_06720 [Bacteroidales bacterium]|nr:hypothetical protein [Bacteroidales bacterium]